MRKHLICISILVLMLSLVSYPAAHAQTEFNDVNNKQYAWAMDAINFMTSHNVISGYPDGTFKPQKPVTKAEFSVMLYRLFDKYRLNTLPEPRKDVYGVEYHHIKGFADVPSNYWAYKEIHEIYDDSFTSYAFAYDDKLNKALFQPNMELSRLQLAKLLYAGFHDILSIDKEDKTLGYKTIASMSDIPYKVFSTADKLMQYKSDGRYNSKTGLSTDYYVVNGTNAMYPLLYIKNDDGTNTSKYDDTSSILEAEIMCVSINGIMTADSSGHFRPLEKITRAEAVTIMYRLFNSFDSKGVLTQFSSIASTGNHNANPPATDSKEAAHNTAKQIDKLDTNGMVTKDLKNTGEIDITVSTAGKKTMALTLQSTEKVDLYLKFKGQTSFIRQEELPMTIPVDGIKEVRITTQVRTPNVNRPADYTTILLVKLN